MATVRKYGFGSYFKVLLLVMVELRLAVSSECYYPAQSSQYNGDRSDINGTGTCQMWSDLNGRVLSLTDSHFPEGSITKARNYCRDPLSIGYVYCFSNDVLVRCNVPQCKECYYPTQSSQYNGYIADINGTGNCQMWSDLDGRVLSLTDSHFPEGSIAKARNYCRDPLSIGYVYCFSNNALVRCNVPQCKDSHPMSTQLPQSVTVTQSTADIHVTSTLTSVNTSPWKPDSTAVTGNTKPCKDDGRFDCQAAGMTSIICDDPDLAIYCNKTCNRCTVTSTLTSVNTSPWKPYSTAVTGNTTTPPPIATVTGYCKDKTWKQLGNYCYYLSLMAYSTWANAESSCRGMGMELASILSRQEELFILGMVDHDKSRNDNVWIGMRRMGGYFRWTDMNSASYINWNVGQPSDMSRTQHQDCVELEHESGKWNDARCTTRNGYVCKAAKLSDTSSPATASPDSSTTIGVTTPTYSAGVHFTSYNSTVSPRATTVAPKEDCVDSPHVDCAATSIMKIVCPNDVYSRQLCRKTCGKCDATAVNVTRNSCGDPIPIDLCPFLNRELCLCDDVDLRPALCPHYCAGECGPVMYGPDCGHPGLVG